LHATDRELAAIENDGTLSTAVRHLSARIKSEEISVDPLLESYRLFLTKSSDEIPCADVTTDWTRAIERFNSMRKDLSDSDGLRTWDGRELKRTASKGEQAELHREPDLADLYRLVEKVYQLRQLSGSPQPRDAKFDTLAWESDIADFISKVDAYDPSKSDCPDCAYFAKGKVLLLFFDCVPPGPYKERILDRLVSILATSPLQSRWPIHWLFQVELLLNLSRAPDKDQTEQLDMLQKARTVLTMMPSAMGPRIRLAMKQSNNYAMYVLAKAEDVLPNRFFSPYLK
jgi:hypothetical protein